MQTHHRKLDQIGSGTLERGILSLALAKGPHVEVTVADFGDIAPAAEEGLDIAALAGQGDLAVEKGPHAGEAAEVLGNEGLRVFLRNAQRTGEREGALTVDRGEVDGFGAGAHLRSNLGNGNSEDDCRGLQVDVVPRLERGEEGLVLREVGHKPQLD